MISLQDNIAKIGIAIILAGLLFTLIWYGNTSTPNLLQTDSLTTSPDYFITKLKVREFDTQGNLIETLNADEALHYKKGLKTLLDNPLVERNSNSGSWKTKAQKGVIHDGSNDILLTENAQAVKTLINSEQITLTANNIHYIDEQKALITDGHATLLAPQGKTFADKITTYINSEKIIMTGSIRGNYEPTY